VADITLYPNPNSGVFTISVTNTELTISDFEVYNVLGEKIYSSPQQRTLSPGNYQINMSNQPNGIYIYRAIDKNGKMIGTGRFVKE
jgi:hypothetical protein